MAEITYLTENEVSKLLKGIKSVRDKAIFTVMYYAGLRASEVGKLEMRDLRIGDGRLFIHRLKGSVSGEHILSPEEFRILRIYLKVRLSAKKIKKVGDTLLFPSNMGRGISRSSLYKLFSKYANKIGLPKNRCHPHVLKHSIATHLLENGKGIEDVQDWLGHKDIRNTIIYARVTNKRREETARSFYNR